MIEPEGRIAALEEAYRDHADDLYRIAFGILRDSEAAVDATQVAFARAFERWNQYDERRPLLPWLHGIVVHEALDTLRRARVRRVAVAGSAPVTGPTTEDVARRVADRAAVDAALAELQPSARAAVLLHHVYGYDYAEIGRILGTGRGNVGSILTRANARLRDLLRVGETALDISGAPAPRSTPEREVTDEPTA
jgi:RNA polymerase sigma-70 factor (ECF subfamily)